MSFVDFKISTRPASKIINQVDILDRIWRWTDLNTILSFDISRLMFLFISFGCKYFVCDFL